MKLPDWEQHAATCPRCLALYDGRYPALSRADNTSYICSECGVDEAFIQFVEGKDWFELSQPSDWPVKRKYSLPNVQVNEDGSMSLEK